MCGRGISGLVFKKSFSGSRLGCRMRLLRRSEVSWSWRWQRRGDGVLLYAVVPRGSQKWYVGQAHVKRKDRGRVAAGFPTRMLEHLAAAASAAARLEAKDKGGPKYSLWRALGQDSIVALPLFLVASEAEANSVEMFIVSRDQPGASKKGKKLERAELWRR